MDQSTLEHLAQIGELRLWMRDGNLCWEIIKHYPVSDLGVMQPPCVIAYGADAKSLEDYYESTLLDSVAEL